MAYFGYAPFGASHFNSEPGLAGLRPSVDQLEVTTVALRGTVLRDDLPDVAEIIRRFQEADPHPLGLPFLAGMDEIDRLDRDQLEKFNLLQMQRAVAFYYCFPTNRSAKPKWLLRWLQSQPEMIAEVLIQCAATTIGGGSSRRSRPRRTRS